MTKNILLTVNTFDEDGIITGSEDVEYSKQELVNIINQLKQLKIVQNKNKNSNDPLKSIINEFDKFFKDSLFKF